MSRPSISVLFVPHSGMPQVPSLDGAYEVIVVGANDAECPRVGSTPGMAVRNIHSDAPAAQRANIGISRASGDWVVVLTGQEKLAPDWIGELADTVSDGAFCAHRIAPAQGVLPIVAVWRPAFAYGSLDGRLLNAAEALDNWLTEIFPQHRHRVLPREGFEDHRAAWFEANGEAKHVSMPDRIALTPKGAYHPQRFWEDGGRGWVKWEAYQPDEPEITAIAAQVQPRRVVELGCGGGRNGRYFTGAEHYTGLDISMPLLDRAKDRQEDNSIGLICGDAISLPFADASFDLVFAVSTIQHVEPEKIKTCIADVVRVSQRYICLIEFTEELEGGKWFTQPHMFRHDYASLLAPHAELLERFPTAQQIQPAVKEVFLFEKRRPQ